jgi:hypothetical protein
MDSSELYPFLYTCRTCEITCIMELQKRQEAYFCLQNHPQKSDSNKYYSNNRLPPLKRLYLHLCQPHHSHHHNRRPRNCKYSLLPRPLSPLFFSPLLSLPPIPTNLLFTNCPLHLRRPPSLQQTVGAFRTLTLRLTIRCSA